MTSRSIFLSLSLLLLYLCLNSDNFVSSTLTHDEKQDRITEAYKALKGVVDTLLQVHGAVEEGAKGTENDINALKDSASRSDYQVNVMDSEHQAMLAEAAKRADITPEEAADTEARGEAINEAKQKLGELDEKIAETTEKQNALNSQMKTSNLSPESLQALQEKANEQIENSDEHITMPSTEEIKAEVMKELEKMQTVIDTVGDTTVRGEAQKLKDQIATKFKDTLLAVPGKPIPELIVTAKEIDTLLLMFRNLDIYGSAAKMEL